MLVYFVATILIGAFLAPVLFWTAQWFLSHGFFQFLGKVDFESFFHRALLIAAVVLMWPLLRSVGVRSLSDLGLIPNSRWSRHLLVGFVSSSIPLLICGMALIALHIYSLRSNVAFFALGKVVTTAAIVPFIEEAFFRGLILGLLLRTGHRLASVFVVSALYSVVHFLKAPEQTSTVVKWTSGFTSIANSFGQFTEPMLVFAAFTTLFLIGWILADARLRTRSLWLPIGLHAGWIFGNSLFSKLARRELVALPWLGRNLLVGIIPLGVAAVTWIIVLIWLKNESKSNA